MPVFFTYAHEDKDFVDRLARQLVDKKAWVWVDRWELKVGDSIVERVQSALQEASAVVVVLSPASVASRWVTRELSSTLYREVENTLSLIVPVLIEDCQIPAFLRDRLYADFRSSFDDGLRTLMEALAKVTNATQGRTQTPDFHTDWALDRETRNGRVHFRITLIDHSTTLEFSILTQILLIGNEAATKRYELYESGGFYWIHLGAVLDGLAAWANRAGSTITLADSRPLVIRGRMDDRKSGLSHDVELTSRWVGTDTGKDILFPLAANLERIVAQWKKTIRPPSEDELGRVAALLLNANSPKSSSK